MTTGPTGMVRYVVPEEAGEVSICDITPTILDFFLKKGFHGLEKVEGGTLNGKIELTNIFTTPFKDFCGQPLTEIIEDRINIDLSDLNRIIVILVDGLSFKEFFKCGKDFYRKNQPEIIPAMTVFPSMTVTATTSLFTGVFPFLHGVITDKFYDCNSEQIVYFMPRSTEKARYVFPLALTITDYAIDPVFEANYKVSLVSAGISHNDKIGRNFITDFFGQEFEVTGDYVAEKSNKRAFQETKGLLRKYYANDSNFVLFVRFTIDWLTHRFGINSAKSIAEAKAIFDFITLLAKEASHLWPDKRTLFLVTSDHGHKSADGGLVTISDIKDRIKKEYQHIISNQSVLHFYDELYRALILKSKRNPIVGYIRKDGHNFLAFDVEEKRWTKVTTFYPEEMPVFSLYYNKFGVGYTVGEFILIADNFYFGSKQRSEYPKGYLNLRGIHGGISICEINVPLLFWCL